MKYQIIKIYLVAALLLIFNYESRAEKTFRQNEAVKITLKIPDTSIKDIEVLFIENNLNGSIGSKTVKFKQSFNGQFQVKLPASDKPMRVTIFSADKRLNLVHYNVEPGDDIIVRYLFEGNSTKVRFSGKGSMGFKIKHSIDSMNFADTKPYYNKIYTANKLIEVLKQSDSSETAYLNLIEKDRHLLSKTMYQLQRANIIGTFTMGKCFFIQMFLSKTKNKKDLVPTINNFLLRHSANILENDISTYSEDYIKGKIQLIKLKIFHSQFEEGYSHEDFYDLTKSLPAKLREKVLVYYFLSKPKIGQDRMRETLKETIRLSKDSDHIMYLKEILSNAIQGTMAFNFELSDENGKIVKLSDFKGKTIFIDFWFTGCSPCIDLAEQLHTVIIPKFKNSDIVFISVNLDTKKEVWLKSLSTGKYTSSYGINLYTDGKAFTHPLAKFYLINGCPTTLLVDRNGYNYETNMKAQTEAIITAIDAALK